MPPPADALAPEDRVLLERLADRVVELRAEVPAILTLETSKPIALIASQAMIFFEPMVQALFRFSEYRRIALLIERREAIETLITMIESRADRARDNRRTPAGPSAPPAR